MSLHRPNYRTAYEVTAINSVTGERIFVAVSNAKSRASLQRVLFRALDCADDTRLERVSRVTGRSASDWKWSKKASDGVYAGDWTIRFTGRTAKEVDQAPLASSIYEEKK